MADETFTILDSGSSLDVPSAVGAELLRQKLIYYCGEPQGVCAYRPEDAKCELFHINRTYLEELFEVPFEDDEAGWQFVERAVEAITGRTVANDRGLAFQQRTLTPETLFDTNVRDMEQFIRQFTETPTSEPFSEAVLATFLVTVRHLADRRGVDFHRALDQSYRDYATDRQWIAAE